MARNTSANSGNVNPNEPQQSATQHPPNFGCVALALDGTWDRNMYMSKTDRLVSRMVGHSKGVADAHLKDRPWERHQFAWVNAKNDRDLTLKIASGYEFVTEKDWNIIKLWMWREGRAWYKGDNLMWRPAQMFYEEQDERNAMKQLKDRRKERDTELANAAAESGVAFVPVDPSTGGKLTPYQRS